MSDVLRFDLAKDPKGNPITYGRVGDSNGLTRRVKVFEDGKPLNLTGWTTTFEGNTSNWQTKVFDTEGISIIDAVKGEFSYTFPNMAFAVEGQYERAYFSFIKGDQRKSTGNFEIIVLGNSDIDAPEAETIITEYNKLVAELRALQKENISDLQSQQDEYIKTAESKFADITSKITSLQTQIANYKIEVNKTATDAKSTISTAVTDAKNTISTTAIEAVKTVAEALEQFKEGNFYTKLEADNRFAKPADITKAKAGLGNVDNYATATQAEAEAGTVSNKFMTPIRTSQQIDKRIATQEEVNDGTNSNKFITPATLKEASSGDDPVIRLSDLKGKLIKVNEWVPLTLNTGFKGADGTIPKYRIIEYPNFDGTEGRKKIEFDGAWTNSAGSIPSTSPNQLQWCILPKELRPAQTKMFPAQCSAFSATGRVAFVDNGICYGAQNSGAAVTYMYITGMSYWIGE